MNDLTPIREWIDHINKPPQPEFKPAGPVYKVKCKNCGHVLVFEPDKQTCGVCPCGSRVVRLTDDGKGCEEYYSSHNIE